MAGGLNDLELETLEEVNLSPPLAPRPPPAVPARRARRIVSSVAIGVTLVLALITWVSLRVDTPPKGARGPGLGIHSTGRGGRRPGDHHPGRGSVRPAARLLARRATCAPSPRAQPHAQSHEVTRLSRG